MTVAPALLEATELACRRRCGGCGGAVIAGVILAAGSSSRFGAVKQLVELNGTSLLGHAIQAMSEVEAIDETVVVLGANAQAIMRVTPLGTTRVVVCRSWEDGVSASLSAGLRSVSDAGAVVITLADQPLIGTAAIRRVVAARDGAYAAIAAGYPTGPAHPILLERTGFEVALGLTGEQGVGAALNQLQTKIVPCDDVAELLDVDIQADLDELRRRLDRPPDAKAFRTSNRRSS